MGRLGKAFKSKRKPGAGEQEEEDGEGSGSEHEKQQQQQPKQQAPPSPPPPKKAAAAAPAAAADGDDDDEEAPAPSAGPETRGQMVQRHKREHLALKKSSQRAKGGGKAEAAKALADLEARHAKELAQLDAKGPPAASASSAAAASAPAAAASTAASAGDRASKYLAGVSLADGAGAGAAPSSSKGPTKAQKRREKLAQREQERDARIAAELAALGPTERAREASELRALLAPLGLRVKSIRADGHCLYHSVADQLAQHPTGGEEGEEGEEGGDGGDGGAPLPDYLALRRLAAEHMRARRGEFEPFVAAAAEEVNAKGRQGEDDDEEEEAEKGGDHDLFEAYVRALESTAAWGGHVELTALAGALRRPIRVVAAGMPAVAAGEEFGGKELTVCYVRHEFGLGEHYNSVRPKEEGEEEDEDEEGEGEAGGRGGGGDDEDDDE